jgi:hypothetical protein
VFEEAVDDLSHKVKQRAFIRLLENKEELDQVFTELNK